MKVNKLHPNKSLLDSKFKFKQGWIYEVWVECHLSHHACFSDGQFNPGWESIQICFENQFSRRIQKWINKIWKSRINVTLHVYIGGANAKSTAVFQSLGIVSRSKWDVSYNLFGQSLWPSPHWQAHPGCMWFTGKFSETVIIMNSYSLRKQKWMDQRIISQVE